MQFIIAQWNILLNFETFLSTNSCYYEVLHLFYNFFRKNLLTFTDSYGNIKITQANYNKLKKGKEFKKWREKILMKSPSFRAITP